LATDDHGNTLIYDAWNQLVQVKSQSGSILSTYSYDGLGRRVIENSSGTARDLYYSDQWQVLEERIVGQARLQYVWSPVGTDTLVERDRDPTGGGSLSERLYVQQDANRNVTALVDTSGNVVERYIYDPYGMVSYLSPSWSSLGSSAYSMVYLHQGLRLDVGAGWYDNRARVYSPTLGRFGQTDPLGLKPDTNPYRYEEDLPSNGTDPSGLLSNQTRAAEAFSLRAQISVKVKKLLDQIQRDPRGYPSDAYYQTLKEIRQLYQEHLGRFGGMPDTRLTDAVLLVFGFASRAEARTKDRQENGPGLSVGVTEKERRERQKAWLDQNTGVLFWGPQGNVIVDPWGRVWICGMG